jgi:hypothetical protein
MSCPAAKTYKHEALRRSRFSSKITASWRFAISRSVESVNHTLIDIILGIDQVAETHD